MKIRQILWRTGNYLVVLNYKFKKTDQFKYLRINITKHNREESEQHQQTESTVAL